jgi:steroid 5-alpha reductase family enzyme
MGPDFSALNGTSIETVIGALLTIVLVAAVASLIVCGICWAIGSSTGNYQLESKGRTGVLIALGTAAAAGAGVALVNWLVALGQHL